MSKITPFLWFQDQAEEAAKFYASIFDNSRIVHVSRSGEGVPNDMGGVVSVAFELDGNEFVALNGRPGPGFTESVSFSIDCRTQEEIDHYWAKLTEGGEEQQCGWLKDRYGVSWQVTPRALGEMLGDPDAEKSRRVMEAMMSMKKIDFPALQRAYTGAAE